MASKTLTGARAKLYINGALAGVFNSVNYGVSYDVQPLYILGRHNVGELVYTGMNEVSVRASGFRVVDNGPFVIGAVPKLQELLTHQDITLTIVDRAPPGNKIIMTVLNVKPTGFDSSTVGKGVADLSVSFVGTTFSDETGPQEDTGATSFG